jgi:hypothetical protein
MHVALMRPDVILRTSAIAADHVALVTFTWKAFHIASRTTCSVRRCCDFHGRGARDAYPAAIALVYSLNAYLEPISLKILAITLNVFFF